MATNDNLFYTALKARLFLLHETDELSGSGPMLPLRLFVIQKNGIWPQPGSPASDGSRHPDKQAFHSKNIDLLN